MEFADGKKGRNVDDFLVPKPKSLCECEFIAVENSRVSNANRTVPFIKCDETLHGAVKAKLSAREYVNLHNILKDYGKPRLIALSEPNCKGVQEVLEKQLITQNDILKRE